MILTDSERLYALSGEPFIFQDVCLIYPAKMREIARLGYDKFQRFLFVMSLTRPVIGEENSHLTDEEKALKELLNNITDFQFFMFTCQEDKDFEKDAKDAFYFFTHEEVNFLYSKLEIVIGPIQEKHIINEGNFPLFVGLVRAFHWLGLDEELIVIDENDSEVAKNYKRKWLERQRLMKKAKPAQSSEAADEELLFSDLLASATLGVPGLTLANIWELTYYALRDQLTRMGWHDEYDMNTRAAMAGAKIKKDKLKHWIRTMKFD